MIGVFTTAQVYVLPPMPDKPSTVFALSGHRLLALRGPDAVRFAHAQFMSDVSPLPDGHWQWSGWLTPKGRVLALFALLRLDPQQLWLLLPDADPASLAAQLQRFVFRSKVALDVRGELAVTGAFAADAQARGATMAMRDADHVVLDMGGDGGARCLSIAPADASQGASAAVAEDAAQAAAWRAFDLAHGLPRLEGAQADRWTPQQLSLDRLRAYSVKKGCYPGQEIVARTHFLGQAKRGLRLLEPAVAATPGDVLHDAGGAAAGEVVCAAPLPGGRHLVHAVAPLDAPADGFVLHGQPAPARAFTGGLAR